MFIISAVLLLTRSQKDVMSNCFDQKADINIFTDTMQIFITVHSLRNELCDLPRGVLVSLFINGLGSYEPQVYVYDFDYYTTTQFVMNCTDPLCLNLKDSASGQIIIESKSDVVYIPAGSIRISQGHSEDCFYNDDTIAYIMKGGIQFKMFPTPACPNFITWNDAGVTKLLAPVSARVYINYPDNTMTTHENLAMELTNDIFTPDSATSLLFTVKNDNISKYFDRGLKFVRLQLVYKQSDILRIVETNTNQYGLLDLSNVYSSAEIQIQKNGFMLKTTPDTNMNAANSKITNLGGNSAKIFVIMSLKNVSRTFEFRERIEAVFNGTYQFSDNPQPFSCSDYSDQNCTEHLKKLMSYQLNEVSVSLAYYVYGPEPNYEVLTNYSIKVNKITDSCFDGGLIDYDQGKQTASVSVYLNTKSMYCVLVKDNLLTVRITNTATKETRDFQKIFQAKSLSFQLNLDLDGNPDLQVDIIRSSILEESIRIESYVQKSNSLAGQMMQKVGYVWACDAGIVILYGIWIFWIKNQVVCRKPKPKLILQPIEEDY
ncbi:Conserved_hypothetical protein [Hexamita inflata]|uniref:Uncharacterized protein n=1 Tax=Hexamita inflata TaxID=28002 RepID=A0AA86NCU9_9EUKA|nr:Conserved hypothetical protein [Hexamita inflata]